MAEEKFYSALHWAKKAEKSADLAKQYGNDKLNTTNITNCITEIPQDIKLELVDGVLTLKAGSKVYVPNGKDADGSNKFDEVVIASDISVDSRSFATGTYAAFYYNGLVTYALLSNCSSGTTAPSTASYNAWYDTADNLIKNYASGADTGKRFSVPIAIVRSTSGTGTTSIDQVFNGFGYIGSTVFALPGVKGLIPNGRNADGSLRNVEVEILHVCVSSLTGTNRDFVGLGRISATSYAVYRGDSANYKYDEEKNINIDIANNTQWYILPIGYTAGDITSFNPKQPFHAVDRNDSSWVAGQAMPSSKYIDLTLGATGTKYTAPANGWFAFGKRASDVGQFLNVKYVSPAQIPFFSDVSSGKTGNILGHLIPVLKGQIVEVNYSVGGATTVCRFVYAEGEE